MMRQIIQSYNYRKVMVKQATYKAVQKLSRGDPLPEQTLKLALRHLEQHDLYLTLPGVKMATLD